MEIGFISTNPVVVNIIEKHILIFIQGLDDRKSQLKKTIM